MPADVVRDSWRKVIQLNLWWLLLLGSCFFLGGAERLVGPAYTALVLSADFLHVSPVWWGLPPLLAGAALAVGYAADWVWVRAAAYLLGMTYSLSLLVAFIASVWGDDDAGLTGLPTYAFTGAINYLLLTTALQIGLVRRDHRAGE